MDADKEFVEYVVKALVDNPNDVKTERSVDEMGVLIQLTVNPADMGKVIGKDGRTAKSIRTLLRVLGAKHNARVNLKITEPGGNEVRVTDEKEEEEKKDKDKDKAKEVPEEKATEVV
jgi:predicted RNA-binding protein YlqC (UPF0109 family)